MKTWITLIAALFMGLAANAQSTFQKAFGTGQGAYNNKIDHATALCQTADGGYIIAGFSDGAGLGSDDVYMVKFNAAGDTLWTKAFGGSAADKARSVIQTPDGGFVVCGETKSYGVFNNDALLFKTDSLGNLLWTRTFGGSGEDFGSQVIETTDGGLMVIGRTESFGSGGGYFDAWAIKTDASGVVTWTKTYGGSGDVTGNSIQQTSDGGYIITGEESSVNYGALLLKTNSTGDTIWARTIRGSYGLSAGHSVKQTADGGYIVSGYSSTPGIGSYDMVLFKTTSSGSVSWAKAYGSSSLDEARSVVEIPGNGYAVLGYSYAGSTYSQMHAIRTNANGAVTWDKGYHANYGNEGFEIIATSDGGFAMAGDIWNTFSNTLAGVYQATDGYLVKTDATGNSFGCQTDAPGLVSLTLSWSSYASTLLVASGATATSPAMLESPSLTKVYNAGLLMNFDVTGVLCDTACTGAMAVDMCDSSGFYCSGVGPYVYAWSSNTGSQTGPAATGLCGGTYQVTVTDATDCSGVGEAQVTNAALPQELCIVTVDSTSTYNLVVWEKPVTTAIDSFRIYREIGGNYKHIGSVAYGDLSEFIDNTNGVSPKTTSYRYKLSTVDTCGNESAQSPYHETVHLTVNLGNPPAYNLIWDNYEGFAFPYYRILRDSSGSGLFEVIDSVTNSNFTYTDATPPSGSMIYAIEIVHPNGCTADKTKNFNSSKSNTSSAIGGALNASTTSNDATPGNCNGNAGVTATGGTAPYTYAWNTFPVQTTSVISGLCQGTYTVTVTDNAGASVTASVQINESSGQAPVANFTANKTSIAPGDSVNFIDLSTNSPTSWSWTFTNGTPFASTDQNPVNIVYNIAGCHEVTLIAANGNGSGPVTKSCYIQVGTIGLEDTAKKIRYNISPNPFSVTTLFNFYADAGKVVELQIVNIIGECVYRYNGTSHGGLNTLEWSTTTPGVYLLKARIGNQLIMQKMVKL